MEGSGEPAPKRVKHEETIFKTFDKCLRSQLDKVRKSLRDGMSDLNLRFLKIRCANANASVSFSKATCDTESHVWPESSGIALTGKKVKCVIGSIFVEGLDMMEKYFKRGKIPEDPDYQKALEKLLTFLSKSREDNEALFEDMKDMSEGDWAIRVAQHLLVQLSVYDSYLIDSYKGCNFSCCPCPRKDHLLGFTCDTSFGCENSWHGKPDIIVQDIPVTVQMEGMPALRPEPSAETAVSSIDNKFLQQHKAQLKAQTITFSPLQEKTNKCKLRNSLVPGIGISTKYLLVNFYDSVHDVLLTSKPLTIFKGEELMYSTILFLWLTLNYRLLCSGLTETMKPFKAGFFDVVDISTFRENVRRPLHVSHEDDDDDDDDPTDNPGLSFNPPPSLLSKYIDP